MHDPFASATLEHVHDSAESRAGHPLARRRAHPPGKCGSIGADCSSLSQNRFLLMNRSPDTKQNRIVEAARINEF
jgi:hypothetical protein